MWAEHLDQQTIDSRIWPRAAAIAERFWSSQNVRDVDDMYRRLSFISVELETLGLRHLTSKDAGLRSLVKDQHIDTLRTFATAFEPVSFGERYQEQHTSQLTPLTSFVDAVTPDPPIRHELEGAARQFLAAPTEQTAPVEQARQTLLHFFDGVAAAVPKVEQEMDTAPRLQPVRVRAEQLAALAQIGKQAVQFLSTGTTAESDWKKNSLAQIDAARKPVAMVRFVFLDPLADLVNATK